MPLLVWAIWSLPVLFSLTQGASAESINAYGISFPVNELKAVDGESVKVSLFGTTRIVKRNNLETYVVDLFLRQERVQDLVPYEHMQKLIGGMLLAGNVDLAAKALLILLRSYPEAEAPLGGTLPNAIQFIESLAWHDSSLELFKRCLTNVPFDSLGREHTPLSTEHVVYLLYYAALGDLPWVRTHAARGVFLFVDEFKRVLSAKFIEAVHDEKPERLVQILAVGQEFFGENEELIQRLRVLISRIEQIRDGGPEDVVSLEAFIQVCKADPFSEQALCPVINQYIIRKAEQALASDNPEHAMLFLARIDIEKRSPKVHDIVLRTVKSLSDSSAHVLRDTKVDSFLQAIANVDADILAAYVDLLERQAAYLRAEGSSADFERVFSALVKLRADPSQENDEVRVKLAMVYLREDLRSRAIYTLSKIETGISVMQRFRLSLAGLYVNRYVAYLLLILLIVLTSWYLQFEFKRIRAARLAALEREKLAASGDFSFGPIDVDELERRHREGELHPDLMEYEKLLSKLGLGIKASVKDIKTTYRNMVKSLHPDLTQGSGVETSTEFIELTKAYDRILDLRKILGLIED